MHVSTNDTQTAYLEEDSAKPKVDLEQRARRKRAKPGKIDPVQGSRASGRREHMLNGMQTDGRYAKDCDRDADRSEGPKSGDKWRRKCTKKNLKKEVTRQNQICYFWLYILYFWKESRRT